MYTDRLLLINDLINNVIKRYDAFKAGDRSATAEIDPACVPRSDRNEVCSSSDHQPLTSLRMQQTVVGRRWFESPSASSASLAHRL